MSEGSLKYLGAKEFARHSQRKVDCKHTLCARGGLARDSKECLHPCLYFVGKKLDGTLLLSISTEVKGEGLFDLLHLGLEADHRLGLFLCLEVAMDLRLWLNYFEFQCQVSVGGEGPVLTSFHRQALQGQSQQSLLPLFADPRFFRISQM